MSRHITLCLCRRIGVSIHALVWQCQRAWRLVLPPRHPDTCHLRPSATRSTPQTCRPATRSVSACWAADDVLALRVQGRIYLPLEDLRRFGVTEESILERSKHGGQVDDNYRRLMQFQIDRAMEYYKKVQHVPWAPCPNSLLPVCEQRPSCAVLASHPGARWFPNSLLLMSKQRPFP